MKKLLCVLLGHDWVESPTLTLALLIAFKLNIKPLLTIYKCRRCGTPGFH